VISDYSSIIMGGSNNRSIYMTYHNRGVAQVEIGDAPAGLSDLLKKGELGHASGGNHYYFGKAKFMLGDKKAAAEKFAKACALDPAYKNKPYK
jgi:hypothetical protein